MSSAARRAEFFALEAREYLADLEPLAMVRDIPDAERLVRGARALRGAALMAGLGTFARAAAGLEAIARQVRDHALGWEPDAREAWSDGLGTLRGLVARAPSWEAGDDRQALALAERLERVAAGQAGRPAPPPATALTPGVRAFIARESTLIAGSLEQAALALSPVPPPAALAAVLERMQSLRGLGASAELSPLPELLDAMEVATRTLLANVPAPPDVAAVFTDAAHALAAMARAVAESGRLNPPPGLDALAARLLDSYATERDVVPIASLAPLGVESIAQRGKAPAASPDGEPIPVELVGVGDHLQMVADALARPTSPAARDLRLFVLHRTLATMPARSGTGRFLTPLAEAITTAIGHRVATERPEAFVAMLRDCGRFLVEAGSATDPVELAQQRDALAAALVTIGLGVPKVRIPASDFQAAAPPGPDPFVSILSLAPEPEVDIVPIESLVVEALPDIVPIESLAFEEEPEIVSIESLAPDDFSDVVPIESLAPSYSVAPEIPAEAPGAPSRLEYAFSRRRDVTTERGEEPPSLAGLIAAEIIPIHSLLYRGHSALARADEIRDEIIAMLNESTVSLDRLRPYITEILDLVPLARDAA